MRTNGFPTRLAMGWMVAGAVACSSKEDTGEVQKGFECGLMVEGFNDIKVGDIIEAYEIVEEAATL